MHGEPLGRAMFRYCPEDFSVDEIIDFQPSNEGEHLLLHIQKRDQNTQWVAGLLAELAGIERRAVGFCGLKDRFAVTTQWFSLHLPGREITQQQLQHEDFQILSSHRHHQKLRRGMHAGNRFNIVLRDFNVDTRVLYERLERIRCCGVPNYFAEQRFGRQGNNLNRAAELIAEGRLKGNKYGTGMYLSAARSWLFNLLLDSYLGLGSARFGETGALWGRGRSASTAELGKMETEVLANWEKWCDALEHAGLKQERRLFLLQPENFTYQCIDKNTFELSFDLLAGCYATAVLREIAKLFRPDITAL
ncbi:MAG: tRNA pseudouridine(13) synthase TruD [Porticoccaceae bacterium]|nr:tRNA pseudouridine(13) synthase TruD [Porticoccaceae bacterium]